MKNTHSALACHGEEEEEGAASNCREPTDPGPGHSVRPIIVLIRVDLESIYDFMISTEPSSPRDHLTRDHDSELVPLLISF